MIDLDAAHAQGRNAALIEELLDLAPAASAAASATSAGAIGWLDRGARKVILGTAARPEILRALPRERVIAALDARHGEVVVEGWQQGTGRGILERIAELRDLVGGFLVTFVEREGRMGGTDLELAKEIRAAAGDAAVTIAGGVTTAEEIAALDEIGCDAQVGMALYTGRLDLADAIMAPLGHRPAGRALSDGRGRRARRGLGLSAIRTSSRCAPRWSAAGHLPVAHARPVGQGRDQGRHPGAAAHRPRLRPRRPALRRAPAAARLLPPRAPAPAGARTTGLGDARPPPRRAQASAPEGSYTAKLFADPDLLGAKLREEADELAEAATRADVIWEAADVLYFTLATLAREGIDLAEVERALDRRALKVTRRE